MPCTYPVSEHFCRSKFNEGRTGDPELTRIVLHATDLPLEQLTGQMQTISSAISGYNSLLAPGTYPAHVSFHYGISDCRVSQYVLDADQAYSMGSGVDQDDFTDINSINVAVVTGQGFTSIYCPRPIDNYFSSDDISCLAKFLCCKFSELGVDEVGLTNLAIHGDELPDLDIDNLITQINVCLAEPPEVITTFCDELAAALGEGGEAIPGATLLVGADCLTYTIPEATGGDSVALVATDSTTIDFTTSGTLGHQLTGSVKLSASTNLIAAAGDGLIVTPASVVALATVELRDNQNNLLGHIFT